MATAAATSEPSRSFSASRWVTDLAAALAISVAIFASYAAAGFPTLFNPGGDNDSMLRLVQVRDLLGGQGWFDLHQYRMGPEGGFIMHWSRLVDAPLAGLIAVASAFGAGPALAEDIALVLWPLLMMAATLFGLIRIARRLGNEHTVFPATVLGAAALYFVGIYQPGSIDHHNIQIALTVAAVAFLVKAPDFPWFPAFAGIAAAAMLAIGMETAPYVAVAGAAVALCFLFGNEAEARRAAGFGLAFAAAAFVAFLVTVGPSRWAVAECDAMSNVQLSLAAFGGIGLALVALAPATNATMGRRFLGLAGLAVAFLAVARFGFPQCVDDPFVGMDPRLRSLWLDYVSEAQSVVDLARADWTKVLTYFATPAIGLACLVVHFRRDGLSRGMLIYGGFLLAAFLVSCWQVRGSFFSIPLATVALAIGVGRLREHPAADSSMIRTVTLVAAWLASTNIVWSAAAGALSARMSATGMVSSTGSCSAAATFAELAALPAGTVLAVSDLGSPILVNTAHRVLAGPYHRNIAGNLAMIDAFLAGSTEAEAIARANDVDYVVICRGNAENANFSREAPGGLMADLLAGRTPGWLAPDTFSTGQALEIYRFVSPANG